MKLFALLLTLCAAEEAGLLKATHGICLDANQRNTLGGKVSMWGCSSSNKNQQFTYDPTTRQLKNKYGLCLHSADRRNGATLDMWRCDKDDYDQRFYVQPNGLIEGNNHLDGSKKKLCIDASQRNKYGGLVHMWQCDANNKNQHWTFDKEKHIGIDQPNTKLIKALYGKCLDANQRSTNGGKISMWACSANNKNQQWKFDSKTHLIQNVNSNHCLRNTQKKNGGLVEMWRCDVQDTFQHWWLDEWNNQFQASGTKDMKPGASKLCLDASQRNNDGGKVHVWECDRGNKNQLWKADPTLGFIADQKDTGLVKVVEGKCLDANQRSTNGGKVSMWKCSPSNKNQQWSYDAQTKQLKNSHGFCLRNQEKKNGGKVEMWSCDKDDIFQRWWYDRWTNTVKTAQGSSKKPLCLDASKRNDNGGLVHIWECMGNNANQRWHMDATGHIGVDFPDTGFLKNQHGRCVDAHKRHEENGKVAMWRCEAGNKNQVWQYSTQTRQIKNKYGKCLSYNAHENGGVVDMNTCDDKDGKQRFWYDPWRMSMKVTNHGCNGNGCCLDASQRNTNSGKLHIWQCDSNNNNQKFIFDPKPFIVPTAAPTAAPTRFPTPVPTPYPTHHCPVTCEVKNAYTKCTGNKQLTKTFNYFNTGKATGCEHRHFYLYDYKGSDCIWTSTAQAITHPHGYDKLFTTFKMAEYGNLEDNDFLKVQLQLGDANKKFGKWYETVKLQDDVLGWRWTTVKGAPVDGKFNGRSDWKNTAVSIGMRDRFVKIRIQLRSSQNYAERHIADAMTVWASCSTAAPSKHIKVTHNRAKMHGVNYNIKHRCYSSGSKCMCECM